MACCAAAKGKCEAAQSPLGMWLPTNHEKRDGRKARDGKKEPTCPHSIHLQYEILEVRRLDQIAARLIDAR